MIVCTFVSTVYITRKRVLHGRNIPIYFAAKFKNNEIKAKKNGR